MGSLTVRITGFHPVDPGSIPGPRILIKMQESEQKTNRFERFYNKNYKKFLLIPLILLILSLGYIFYFYNQNGDFIKKDVSLTGGTSITLFSENIQNIVP